MKVSVVGTGNVATVLGKTIKAAGHHIVQVAGRNAEKAAALAQLLDAAQVDHVAKLSPDTDLVLIAVTDHSIASVAAQLPAIKGMLVHTAASVSLDVLKDAARQQGIIYPLQSLNRERPVLPSIPVLIDGNTGDVQQNLSEFANTWSPQVVIANEQQRLSTHVAAVMVNNFTNHLVALAEDFCKREGVDFKILLPLIQHTMENVGTLPAARMQTGPAVRGDISVIDKHLQLLNRYPALRNLYLKITESIINHQRKHSSPV